MILLSENFERIDKKEKAKVEELHRIFESGKPLMPDDIFESKSITEIVEERPLSICYSFDEANATLPLNSLLFSHILVTICPKCGCVKNPELLEPYLEKELVLPILSHPLSHFSSDFANLVIQHPYIGVYTLFFLRSAMAFSSYKGYPVLCPHCFDEYRERIFKKLSEIKGDTKKTRYAQGLLRDVTFPILAPPGQPQSEILKQIEEAIDQKNLELLGPLTHKTTVLETLRMARIFEATPQVAQRDLSNIGNTLSKMGISLAPETFEQIKEKEWALKALSVDYNPKMPIEDYLDIVLPRRKKINSLVNELILNKGKEKRFSNINDEIWEINREISYSKAVETLTFLTDFVFDNAKILFGIVAGGLVGYSSGSFMGCGLGSMGGLVSGMIGRLVSKRLDFKVPKHPKKTIEWLKEKIESPEERLLSILLSKDIKVIQTWALRRKLERSRR